MERLGLTHIVDLPMLQNTFDKRYIFASSPTLSVFEPPLVGRSPVSAWTDFFRGSTGSSHPRRSFQNRLDLPRSLSPLSSSLPFPPLFLSFRRGWLCILLYAESRRLLHGLSAGVIVQYFYLHPSRWGFRKLTRVATAREACRDILTANVM